MKKDSAIGANATEYDSCDDNESDEDYKVHHKVKEEVVEEEESHQFNTPTMTEPPTSFLDLPTELRSQIYGYFNNFSTKRSTAMKKTQESLMLVSRQVHKDWAPTRYRSMTIRVDRALMPEARKYLDDGFDYCDEPMSSKDHCGPQQFQDLFLSTLDDYKLHNIRRIKYDATIWFEDEDEDMRWSEAPYINWTAIKKLGEVLSSSAQVLQSLEKVVLVGDSLAEPGFMGSSTDCYDYPPRAGKEHKRSKKIWSTANHDGKWDEVAREFRDETSPFKNWTVSKKVWIRLHHNDDFYKHRGEEFHYEIEKVQVAFSKPTSSGTSSSDTPSSDTTTSADDIIPRVFRYMPSPWEMF